MSAYLQSCAPLRVHHGGPRVGGGGWVRERKQRKINETSDRCYDENKSVSRISMGDGRCCENHYKSITSVYPLWPFHNVQRFLPTYILAHEGLTPHSGTIQAVCSGHTDFP